MGLNYVLGAEGPESIFYICYNSAQLILEAVATTTYHKIEKNWEKVRENVDTASPLLKMGFGLIWR